MDEFDEAYNSGHDAGYVWGFFVSEALAIHEPFWALDALSAAIGAINDQEPTAAIKSIQDAMIQARDEWEERRNGA